MNLLDQRGALLDRVDFLRLDACRSLDDAHRSEMGQFLTPPPVARFMASLFEATAPTLRVLDAGAGVGSLSAALIEELCGRVQKPDRIDATTYEIEPALVPYLRSTLDECAGLCKRSSVQFTGQLVQQEFIRSGVEMLRDDLFSAPRGSFDCAILNPPYRKIGADSEPRRLLRTLGIETTNLYAGFLAVAALLLDDGGEMVAITPRSFCNGPYFRPFRRLFLSRMKIRRVHLFESRSRAFRDDDVLQENVIIHAVKSSGPGGRVTISSSQDADDLYPSMCEVDYSRLIDPNDPDLFIHLVPDGLGHDVAEQMRALTCTLDDLGVSVSTGRVVDFRAKDHLRAEPAANTVPLIYPGHFSKGYVAWPKAGKKPNALVASKATNDLLVPSGYYVLVKRFSSKEERRRVVAAVFDPRRVPASHIGFENHLNVYHCDGRGVGLELAKGLAAFLNSTIVDTYFRQFSGHTQVNATDLRSIKYPPRGLLVALGAGIGDEFPDQEELDLAFARELPEVSKSRKDPIRAKKRIDEALSILKALDLPREQQNERSALTLLALLGLEPKTPWSDVGAPLVGITPMMEFFSQHYGKTYAPNSRETVRRFTVHQFIEAGLVLINPDDPRRPTNSPKAVYQIEPAAFTLLQAFGGEHWDRHLAVYRSSVQSLIQKHAMEREMARIPVNIEPGKTIKLSAGGQNAVIKKILEEFCPRFTPGGKVLYIGDTDDKWGHFDTGDLAAIGVNVDSHGKMPDVVVHHVQKNWLLLIEAVTSHGPVNAKRRGELKKLFKGSTAGLVFVTAFLDRKAMLKYLDDISWETEVWVADSPTHLIHFDGEKFLGPYE